MTWMRGARRHWPAAVTDTERDMSKELNTGKKDRNTNPINMWPQAQLGSSQAHQEPPHTHTHIINANTQKEAASYEAHPSFIFQESIKLCSCALWNLLRRGLRSTHSPLQLTRADRMWRREETVTGLSGSMTALSCPCHLAHTRPREPLCTAEVWFPPQLENTHHRPALLPPESHGAFFKKNTRAEEDADKCHVIRREVTQTPIKANKIKSFCSEN